jgi:hypothetical protein
MKYLFFCCEKIKYYQDYKPKDLTYLWFDPSPNNQFFPYKVKLFRNSTNIDLR